MAQGFYFKFYHFFKKLCQEKDILNQLNTAQHSLIEQNRKKTNSNFVLNSILCNALLGSRREIWNQKKC